MVKILQGVPDRPSVESTCFRLNLPTLAAVVEERECTPTASPRVRAMEGDALTDYLQLRIHGKGAIPGPAHPNDLSGSSQIKRLIGDVVFEVLKTVPPCLLFIHTGMVYDRASQILHFERSPEYTQLSSSTVALDTHQKVAHIRTVASTHFRYVTLSHRWGKSEPRLHDVEGQVVYDLDLTDGLSKNPSVLHATTVDTCGLGVIRVA